MKSYCISHRKDVDGLGSCALAVAAVGGSAVLSDYDDFIENLKRIPDDSERIVISDLGVDGSDLSDFLSEISRLTKRAEVTYIDHHHISDRAKRQLKLAGAEVVHDTAECASMLTYMRFRKDLPERARLVALCGAVTDYLDDSPMARKMMEQSDRQFVLLEASMLSYALGAMQGEEGFPERVVDELSKMKQPHEIPGVPEAAVKELRKVSELGGFVKAHGKKKGRLAYMVTKEYATGSVAKLLIGAFEVPVGVAMKEKQDGWYEVSLRSTSEAHVHLGTTIAKIAAKLGGSGGGHRKAAGCRVPAAKAGQMIEALVKKV
jgi:oligoribonuclease NrnB/cAMP/cGMP phosphodiesterase (DHH superfamily)